MSEAVQYFKYREVQLEISQGDFTNIDFFIRTSNIDGFSDALEYASCYGLEDVAIRLVDIGANINHNKSASFRMACTCGHLSLVKYFMSHANLTLENLSSVIIDTLDNDHIEVVRYLLLDENIHLFDVKYSYDFALRLAIKKNLFDIASNLLKFGADINVLDGYLMDQSVRLDDQAAIHFLIENGIDAKYIQKSNPS